MSMSSNSFSVCFRTFLAFLALAGGWTDIKVFHSQKEPGLLPVRGVTLAMNSLSTHMSGWNSISPSLHFVPNRAMFRLLGLVPSLMVQESESINTCCWCLVKSAFVALSRSLSSRPSSSRMSASTFRSKRSVNSRPSALPASVWSSTTRMRVAMLAFQRAPSSSPHLGSKTLALLICRRAPALSSRTALSSNIPVSRALVLRIVFTTYAFLLADSVEPFLIGTLCQMVHHHDGRLRRVAHRCTEAGTIWSLPNGLLNRSFNRRGAHKLGRAGPLY